MVLSKSTPNATSAEHQRPLVNGCSADKHACVSRKAVKLSCSSVRPDIFSATHRIQQGRVSVKKSTSLSFHTIVSISINRRLYLRLRFIASRFFCTGNLTLMLNESVTWQNMLSLPTGYDVSLQCTMEYSNETMADYTWKVESLEGVKVYRQSNVLKTLMRNDSGNYTCTASDVFATAQKIIQIDVQCKFPFIFTHFAFHQNQNIS